MRRACLKGVLLSIMFIRFSLGIVMSVSTDCRSFFIPSSASRFFLSPSRAKGFVTTATVRIDNSLAMEAIIGAAPVPVPPPIPAVIKTISAPFRVFLIVSLSSTAAFSPISGIPPAPRPFVSFVPIGSLFSALLLFRS